MATDCTQETVLRFLMERGGTARNHELIDHFKAVLSKDPDKKALMKDAFKTYVDNVAFVKVENETKYVCLRKKYRGRNRQEAKSGVSDNETRELTAINCEIDGALSKKMHGMPQITLSDCKLAERSLESAGNDDAKQEIPPGSGYRSDNSREEERLAVRDSPSAGVDLHASLTSLVPESTSRSKMGNMTNSCSPDKKADWQSEESVQTSESIPKIAVIEASPLPADGTMFSLPQPASVSQRDTLSEANAFENHDNSKKYSAAVPQNGPGQDKSYEEDVVKGVVRRRKSGGSQRSVGSNISEGSDEGHFDTTSMSGSDTNTPRGSRKNFIELMMNSSPQVRRSMVLRNSVYLSSRHKDSKSDSETGSIVSSNTDDENTPISLDPMEHEWMMCASDGEWESLHRLLACEPNLILKKDFVTGFTCLHWAAKLGKHELLALLVNFAKQHAVPININTRSSAGYTPLHLAAMHNHVEVVKLLVGAYDADVEARDYNGKKACQYLPKSMAHEICDITGAPGDLNEESNDYGEASRWRLSKVLQSNLRPLKLLNHSEEEVCDGASSARVKPLRRKSSLSKMKPKLHKFRLRAQIVHSTSFSDRDLSEVKRHKSPPRSRPMSSLFG